MTGKKYPLVAVQQLFLKSVVDCTWTPTGGTARLMTRPRLPLVSCRDYAVSYRCSSALELVACSLDGSVAYLRFSPQEFGQVYSEAAAKKYVNLQRYQHSCHQGAESCMLLRSSR